MLQKPTILFFIFMFSAFALAKAQNDQQNHTLSGVLKDAANGETLIGATVYVADLNIGTSTNEYGFYSLSWSETQPVEVEFSYVGYEPLFKTVTLNSDQVFNAELGEGVSLNEVVVKAGSYREKLRSSEMSVETITTKEVKVIPALLGESDILRVLQLKPGIPSGSEGSTGLFVRGGGADQNLIVLDDAVVYNASHLFGFFSTFNTDAVKDLKLYKGGFPAQYGGRLSSVIDVKLKEGNKKKFSGSGGLGLISSRLTLEGPIQKDKSSFMVSGRRTYFDVFTNAVNNRNDDPEATQIPGYYFYDLNTKLNFDLSEKDRLYLSGYFGRDEFNFNSDFFNFNFNWGNATGSARWNHIVGPKLFINTTATFSDYQYNISNRVTGFQFDLGSNIQDMSLKSDFFYAASNEHTIRGGIQGIYHQFTVGRLAAGSDDGQISFSSGQDYDGVEFGAYIEDSYKVSDNLEFVGGLRFSGFTNDGTNYLNLEPRFNARWNPSATTTLRVSYARMNQYLHLVSNSGIALPTDVWYPSTEKVKPQRSDQVAVGGSVLLGGQFYLTNEYFYKRLDNQVDFVDGAEIFANENLEDEFAIGKGRAYGTEISIEKREGRLTGWVGYTLQRIERGEFEVLNDTRFFGMGTEYFSPRYDRRHDISLVLIYELTDRLTATGTVVYGSGDLAWLPNGRTTFQDVLGGEFQSVVPVYEDRNNFRLPDFFRVDLGLVWKFFPKWGESDLTFNIVNATDRRNAFFIFLEPTFREVTDVNGNTFEVPEGVDARQVSLFPILPAITWNFKF